MYVDDGLSHLKFTPLLQYLECLLEKLEATVDALEGLRDNEERC